MDGMLPSEEPVTLHQLDIDMFGPLARSLITEHEQAIAEEEAVNDDALAHLPIATHGLHCRPSPRGIRKPNLLSSPHPSSESLSGKDLKRAQDYVRRRYRRAIKAQSVLVNKTKFLNYIPRAIKYTTAQFGGPLIKRLDFNAIDFDSTKPGFIANNYKKHELEQLGKVYSADELLSKGFRLVPWDGRCVHCTHHNAVRLTF